MIKGTTPTLQFNLPFGTEVVKSAEVVIEYGSAEPKELIVKELCDCALGDRCISVSLTQEETLKLPAPSCVKIQLRVLTTDNVALATDVFRVSVERLLKEDVIK